MTDNTNETKKDILLKGRANYLAWITRLESMLSLDDVVKKNEQGKLEISGANEIEKAINEKKSKTIRF